MKRMINIIKGQKGATLIEILVAVSVLGVVSVSLMEARDILTKSRHAFDERVVENNFVRSIFMTLSDKRACENTLLGLNPTGTAGSAVAGIRDEANNVIYAPGDVLGDRLEGSGVLSDDHEITEIRVSHFQVNTDGAVAFNRTGQATVSVSMQRRNRNTDVDAAVGATVITRRFMVNVGLDGGTTGVIDRCITHDDYLAEGACDMVNGTVDPADGRCKSIQMATTDIAGNAITPNADNEAIRVTQNARVEGVTTVDNYLQIGGAPFSSGIPGGSIHATGPVAVDGFMTDNAASITTLKPGDFKLSGRVAVNGGDGTLATSGTVPADGLYVAGNVRTGRMQTYGLSPIETGLNFGATLGFVSQRFSYALGETGTYSDILADVFTFTGTTPTAAIAMNSYVCNRFSLRTKTGASVAWLGGSFTGTTCTFDVVYEGDNCQVDSGQTRSNCARVYGNNVNLGGTSINSWNGLGKTW